MPKTPTFSTSMIEAALEALEHRKVSIEQQMRELRTHLGESANNATPAKRRRRRLSAEARRKMAEGQKRRWANAKRVKSRKAKA